MMSVEASFAPSRLTWIAPAGPRLLPAVAAALRPPERVPLSQWADLHRRLSPEASASPGTWQTLPYQRAVLDALAPESPHGEVVLVWASQLGKTEMLLTLISYIIAAAPGPILVVQPTLAMAEAFSKDRIAPMFRDTPVLQGRVADARAREAGSTIYHRRFLGGHITIVGSNSPAGLASRPIRYLLMDEVDRWEESAGAEGDPAALAVARTRTFWNRKIVYVSSPGTRGSSRIEQAWAESDQRYYHIPCPHCGARQRLAWSRLEWPDGRPEQAQYRCASCERLIDHRYKRQMLAHGEWIADAAGSRAAGFSLSELYSPWRTWGDMARDWQQAQGNVERLRAFINTSLAEWWDDQVLVQANEDELLARREAIGPVLPRDAALLTAGVDIQDDRAEVSVFGWGRGEESWLVEHRIVPGDPSGQELWQRLDDELARQWAHPITGSMQLAAACIDSGYQTSRVMQFCSERIGRRIWPVKGAAGPLPIWPPRHRHSRPKAAYLIGVDSAKATIVGRLKLTSGPGAIHLPTTVDREYIEQLTSEYVRTTYSRGRPVRRWEVRKGRRSEALDCAVYAYAALHGLAQHGIHVDHEAQRLSLLASAAQAQQRVEAPAQQRSSWLGDRTRGWLR